MPRKRIPRRHIEHQLLDVREPRRQRRKILGVNVAEGKVTHQAVAEGTSMDYTPVEDVLGVTA